MTKTHLSISKSKRAFGTMCGTGLASHAVQAVVTSDFWGDDPQNECRKCEAKRVASQPTTYVVTGMPNPAPLVYKSKKDADVMIRTAKELFNLDLVLEIK